MGAVSRRRFLSLASAAVGG
ncbi:twin-arginine translocation signal domain-containing protein, partial [Mycobacterium basiliense]